MTEFWEWLAGIQFARLDSFRSSLTVLDQLWRSTQLPGKPGDMSPVKRTKYLAAVRAHASALQDLLRDTRFDRVHMTPVSDHELSEPLASALYSWGDDESDEGHLVAYRVTPEGRFKHWWDYPGGALTEMLADVVEWTYWGDNWDLSSFGTSAPIAQAQSESTPVIYFCCTLYDWFADKGAIIPFRVLATVANVALELPLTRLVDEDTVRKQVRRYQARTKAGRTSLAD